MLISLWEKNLVRVNRTRSILLVLATGEKKNSWVIQSTYLSRLSTAQQGVGLAHVSSWRQPTEWKFKREFLNHIIRSMRTGQNLLLFPKRQTNRVKALDCLFCHSLAKHSGNYLHKATPKPHAHAQVLQTNTQDCTHVRPMHPVNCMYWYSLKSDIMINACIGNRVNLLW